jgi:2-methylcitrate dehydratase PrpD
VRKGAGIIGTPWRTSPGDAAFANAVLGHALVRDDMHLGSVSHLGVVVIPPLLATVERRPASGRQFIAALVAGYQTGGRDRPRDSRCRRRENSPAHRHHRSDRPARPQRHACSGSMELRRPGDRDRGQHRRRLQRVGRYRRQRNVFPSRLRGPQRDHRGRTGRGRCLRLAERDRGPGGTASRLSASHRRVRSGQREILDVFFKPVPACNYAQSAAQAAREISAKERIDVERVERVEIRVARAAALYPGCDSTGPFEHVLQAKMSIQYNVAAALVKGHFDEANFVPASQPALLRLAARCNLLIDKAFTRAYPGRQGAEVIVYGSAGERWSQRVSDVVPAGEDEVRERFQRAATRALGVEQADKLATELDALEKRPTTRTLAALLQSARSAGSKRPARTGTRRGTGLRAR